MSGNVKLSDVFQALSAFRNSQLGKRLPRDVSPLGLLLKPGLALSRLKTRRKA